jgi:hypothetical protein
VLSAAHARQVKRGVWVLNEKRLVRDAGLDRLAPVFAALGSTEQDLRRAISTVTAAVNEIRTEPIG